MVASQHSRRFHVMTKPIGPIRNLDCKYCFYLEKERLHNLCEKWKMSDEVLETYIRQMIEDTELGSKYIQFIPLLERLPTTQLKVLGFDLMVAPAIKELKAFTKIHLEPGQARTVSPTIKAENLAIWDAEMKHVIEPTEYKIAVGDQITNFVLKGQTKAVD